ncbi:hypothetical protein GCM10010149_84470 [Nonomuraea roseoviolacea subsp. roseoviolacea]|uniref:hypothetical protein n=1 Tax=Nonomuraea roseoviolacea TaxID=103837 RepID=UPI0031CE8B1B
MDMTEWNTSEADASGELISTGADTTAFRTALMTGRLLAPAQLAEMKQTILDDFGKDYGLGVEGYRPAPGLVAWGTAAAWPAATSSGTPSPTRVNGP